jgi:hypothetical protein
MKKSLFALLLLSISISIFAKTFRCEDSVDENIKMEVSFDSTLPNLEYKTIFYNDNGSIESEKLKLLLSANTACGVKVDFKNDCLFEEQESGLGYSFKFICKGQKLEGSIYISENRLVEFKCSNEEHSSVFCLN